jgi:hypothetical protein
VWSDHSLELPSDGMYLSRELEDDSKLTDFVQMAAWKLGPGELSCFPMDCFVVWIDVPY